MIIDAKFLTLPLNFPNWVFGTKSTIIFRQDKDFLILSSTT